MSHLQPRPAGHSDLRMFSYLAHLNTDLKKRAKLFEKIKVSKDQLDMANLNSIIREYCNQFPSSSTICLEDVLRLENTTLESSEENDSENNVLHFVGAFGDIKITADKVENHFNETKEAETHSNNDDDSNNSSSWIPTDKTLSKDDEDLPVIEDLLLPEEDLKSTATSTVTLESKEDETSLVNLYDDTYNLSQNSLLEILDASENVDQTEIRRFLQPEEVENAEFATGTEIATGLKTPNVLQKPMLLQTSIVVDKEESGEGLFNPFERPIILSRPEYKESSLKDNENLLHPQAFNSNLNEPDKLSEIEERTESYQGELAAQQQTSGSDDKDLIPLMTAHNITEEADTDNNQHLAEEKLLPSEFLLSAEEDELKPQITTSKTQEYELEKRIQLVEEYFDQFNVDASTNTEIEENSKNESRTNETTASRETKTSENNHESQDSHGLSGDNENETDHEYHHVESLEETIETKETDTYDEIAQILAVSESIEDVEDYDIPLPDEEDDSHKIETTTPPELETATNDHNIQTDAITIHDHEEEFDETDDSMNEHKHDKGNTLDSTRENNIIVNKTNDDEKSLPNPQAFLRKQGFKNKNSKERRKSRSHHSKFQFKCAGNRVLMLLRKSQ